MTINIDQHIGLQIAKARAAKGWSQADLGAKIGVSEPQMFRYERGGTPVKPELMNRLAKALGVDVTYFLEGL